MTPFLAECFGTAIVIVIGNGVVANVLLPKTKGNNSGLNSIILGWTMAVFIGVYFSSKISGGHLNPMVTISLATAGKFLLSSVLPSLATGLLSGVGSAAGSKVVDKISGSGVMYLKKNGMGCKLVPAGQGLYLAPWHKGSSVGEGLYMKNGSGMYMKTGSGLILGPDSPFKNIPILGMIL